MSKKILPSYIEREAWVYIRQSTMQQVRTRREGQRRQYDLRERAQALGFPRVFVIDEDSGRSGTGSVERPGFGRLLAAVCSGKVTPMPRESKMNLGSAIPRSPIMPATNQSNESRFLAWMRRVILWR